MTYFDVIKSKGINWVVGILEIANKDLCINRNLMIVRNCFYKKICKESMDIKDWLESEVKDND